jgi:DNA invertase Pin-like site-specific DNA recombinase
MLIGLGINAVDGHGACNDEPMLRSMGCDRIFLAGDELELKLKLDEVIQYVRSGDVLAVTELARIGNNADSVIATALRLRNAGASLRCDRCGVVPGQVLGDAFLEVCVLLYGVSHTRDSTLQGVADHRGRTSRPRGRPSALSPDDQARAARLLQERRATVIEVARLLKVSPATIYRYFPRGRSPADLRIASAQNLEPAAVEGSSG